MKQKLLSTGYTKNHVTYFSPQSRSRGCENNWKVSPFLSALPQYCRRWVVFYFATLRGTERRSPWNQPPLSSRGLSEYSRPIVIRWQMVLKTYHLSCKKRQELRSESAFLGYLSTLVSPILTLVTLFFPPVARTTRHDAGGYRILSPNTAVPLLSSIGGLDGDIRSLVRALIECHAAHTNWYRWTRNTFGTSHQ